MKSRCDLGRSERVAEIRSYVAKGLAATAEIFAQRFEKEMEAGRDAGMVVLTAGDVLACSA